MAGVNAATSAMTATIFVVSKNPCIGLSSSPSRHNDLLICYLMWPRRALCLMLVNPAHVCAEASNLAAWTHHDLAPNSAMASHWRYHAFRRNQRLRGDR